MEAVVLERDDAVGEAVVAAFREPLVVDVGVEVVGLYQGFEG